MPLKRAPYDPINGPTDPLFPGSAGGPLPPVTGGAPPAPGPMAPPPMGAMTRPSLPPQGADPLAGQDVNAMIRQLLGQRVGRL